MKTLIKLNGWSNSGDYYSLGSAQGYLNPGPANLASSDCGSACGSKDGDAKPKPSACGAGNDDKKPQPSACGAGDDGKKPQPSACGAGDEESKPKPAACGSSCGSDGK
jgi:ACGX-repeat protein